MFPIPGHMNGFPTMGCYQFFNPLPALYQQPMYTNEFGQVWTNDLDNTSAVTDMSPSSARGDIQFPIPGHFVDIIPLANELQTDLVLCDVCDEQLAVVYKAKEDTVYCQDCFNEDVPEPLETL